LVQNQVKVPENMQFVSLLRTVAEEFSVA